MDDLEGEQLRRELNDQDDMDNLELQYDRQAEAFDIEQYVSDLLFGVQGLGSVKQVKGIEIYVKGPHCEESIKDLIRMCRRDDPDDPIARRKLAGWKTFETDLIQLLLTQYQDKKLAFYLILLMVNLSEQPVNTCAAKQEIYEALEEYKLAFLKPQVIGTLMQHLGDCIENHLEEKRQQQEQSQSVNQNAMSVKKKGITKAHEQMLELIVLLLKNILAIQDSVSGDSTHNEIKKNMHFHLLCQLRREHAFDLLIFLTQDFAKLDVLKKLELVFLEIFYHIFARFDPVWLLGGPAATSELKMLLEKDRLQMKKIHEMVPARHTRFQADFRFKRLLDNTKKLTTNPFQADGVIPHTANGKKQLQKSIARKLLRSYRGIFGHKLHLDMKVEVPLQQAIQGGGDTEELVKTELVTFKSIMVQFAAEFIRYSFCPLFEECYNVLYAQGERLEQADVVYYFVLLGFGLKMVRIVVFENKGADLEIVDVSAALQLTQFQLIFSYFIKEVTQKKKTFNLRNLYCTSYAFLELLKIVKAMSLDTSQTNRKNAQIMLQNIFHHDVTKAVRIGLDFCQRGALNDDVLKVIVELVSVFFELLESYSKGRILTLQTDKLVKQKKKKNGKAQKRQTERELEGELNDFIEKVPGDEDDDGDADGDGEFDPTKETKQPSNQIGNYEESRQFDGGKYSDCFVVVDECLTKFWLKLEKEKKRDWEDDDDENDDDDEEDEDAPRFQERKYNLQSEFAILADYAVLEKVLWLIQDDKILLNSPALNNAVFKFLQRITDLLQADWLFYQVDFLAIMQGILANKEIRMRMETRQFVDLFRKILKKMFEKLKENKLLVVEMLFRFTDFSLKNSILCNYEDLKSKEEDQELNDDIDNNLNPGLCNFIETISERKLWIEQEDRALLNNYETFKELPNLYEQLALVLNGLGYYDKSPIDIRRRVKHLKLHKGLKRAEKIFKEIYSGKKKSIKEALSILVKKLSKSETLEGGVKDFLLFIETMFANYKEYLVFAETGQEEHKPSELDKICQVQDFAVVPVTPRDFDLLNMEEIQGVLESLGMKRAVQGQSFWRIPGYFSVTDLNLLQEKLTELLQDPEKLLEDLGEEDKNENKEEIEDEVEEEEDDDDNEGYKKEKQDKDDEEDRPRRGHDSQQKKKIKKSRKSQVKKEEPEEEEEEQMEFKDDDEPAFVRDYEGNDEDNEENDEAEKEASNKNKNEDEEDDEKEQVYQYQFEEEADLLNYENPEQKQKENSSQNKEDEDNAIEKEVADIFLNEDVEEQEKPEKQQTAEKPKKRRNIIADSDSEQ